MCSMTIWNCTKEPFMLSKYIHSVDILNNELHSIVTMCSYNTYPMRGFPGGLIVKNQPANVGDMGSIPGPGRFHTWEQLSLCSTATEATLQSPETSSDWAHTPWSLPSAAGEAAERRGPRDRSWSSPCLPRPERSPRSNRDPVQPKMNRSN